jgi:hypothetical protein
MAHTPLAARKSAESDAPVGPKRFRVVNRTQAIIELPKVEGMAEVIRLYPEIDKSVDGKSISEYEAEGDVAARLMDSPIFRAFHEKRMIEVTGPQFVWG